MLINVASPTGTIDKLFQWLSIIVAGSAYSMLAMSLRSVVSGADVPCMQAVSWLCSLCHEYLYMLKARHHSSAEDFCKQHFLSSVVHV